MSNDFDHLVMSICRRQTHGYKSQLGVSDMTLWRHSVIAIRPWVATILPCRSCRGALIADAGEEILQLRRVLTVHGIGDAPHLSSHHTAATNHHSRGV